MTIEQRDQSQGEEFTVPQGTFTEFVEGWKKRGEGTPHGISYVKLNGDTTVIVDGGCGHFHLIHERIEIQVVWKDHSKHIIDISPQDEVLKTWKGGLPNARPTPPMEVIQAAIRGEPLPEWWKEREARWERGEDEHKGPWMSDSVDFPQALELARQALITGEAIQADPRFMCD